MTRGGCMVALGATLIAASCAHTKSTDKGTESAAPAQEGSAAKSSSKEAGKSERRAAARDRDATPVASAPEALLAPGADKKIREKLAADGFIKDNAGASGAAMREGVRKFQEAKDLPATGIPDHETVKRLGLNPDEIFRKQGVKD